ncbi:flagellin [Salinibacter ruber]|uniref:flagellin n=1 Tax=Salinibacter ruber TaxID=146919 RepID=UPI00311AA583
MSCRENRNVAQSRIQDADFAKEQTQAAKLQVQQQSGTAQLAQANAAGQSVLSLLQ